MSKSYLKTPPDMNCKHSQLVSHFLVLKTIYLQAFAIVSCFLTTFGFMQGQHANRKSGVSEHDLSGFHYQTQGLLQWEFFTSDFAKLFAEEYEQAPTSKEQAQVLVSAMCQYRLQHQFDFIIGQDHEEYLLIGESTESVDRTTLPDFLEKNIPQGYDGLMLDKVICPY